MALERGATAFVTETDTVVHDPKTAGKKTSRKGKCDRLLFAAVILLAVVGICMVLSTSHYTNLLKNKTGIDAYKPFISQLIYCVLGVGIMVFLCSMKDYVWIRKWSRLLWWVGIVLLVLVLISPSEANGAGRWIKLGPIQIQPAEFVKYFVLVSVAAYLQKHPKPTLKRFIMILLMTVIPALLIFMQKALSMTIVVLLMCYCVLLISGTDAAKM